MNNDLTKYVADWFVRGDDDLSAVKTLFDAGGVPNTICFHAQQAGEKYLKGFLAHHGKHVRKIHDLEVLLDASKTIDPSFESLRDDARFLSQFYVESRYPDDYAEFSREDAERAYEAALRIKRFVLAKVKPPESSAGFSALALLAVIAGLVVVVGVGFLAYQRYTVAPAPEKSASESVPTAEGVDISDWETYRNEKYGYEVKYPEGYTPFSNPFIAKGKPLIPAVPSSNSITIADTEDYNKLFDDPSISFLSISIYKSDSKTNAREWLTREYFRSSEGGNESQITQRVLGGRDFVGITNENILPYWLFVSKEGDYFIVIEQTQKSEFLEGILTTFKFIK